MCLWQVPTYKGWTRCPGDPFRIIHENWLCDGVGDCEGGGDEQLALCERAITYCSGELINCPDSPELCLPAAHLCDHVAHCPRAAADEDPELCREWNK